MKTSKKEFNKKLILLVCSAVYFGLVLILTSFISHAASEEDYFPMSQNKNNHFNSSVIGEIESQFNSNDNYIFAYWGGTQGPWNIVYVAYYAKSADVSLFGEKNNDLIHFSLYQYGPGVVYYSQMLVDDTGYTGGFYGAGIGNFQNLTSSNYSTGVDYVSNYQLYTGNSDSKKIVLLYDDGVTIPEDNTARDDTEKPNINNYIPSDITPPTFDNSTIENAIGSVFNYLNYSTSKITNIITGMAQYISDGLMWGLQKVINNIRQVLQNVSTELQEVISDFSDIVSGFLSDIQDLISDFKDKLSDFYDGFMDFADLFIHPFDEEEFEEQIAACQLITQYDELLDNCDIIREVFETAQEKDSFILYIDFENPFADSEHKIITSEINFNWLVPLRSVYRPFLWVFALLDCFIGGCQLLGNIIGGKAK